MDLRPAIRAAVTPGDPGLECRARLAAAAVALRSADIASADRELAQVAAVAGNHPLVLWCQSLAAAHRHLLAGDVAGSERLATEASHLGRAVDPVAAARAHAVQLAAAGLARGTVAPLAPTLAELSRSASPPTGLLDPHARAWIVLGPAITSGGPVALTLARLRLAGADLPAAAAAVEQVPTGATAWGPHLRLERARQHAAGNRPGSAEAALREAKAARLGAAERGLVGIVRRADELIAAPAASAGTGLTRREQEVAALAIRGASAREIAEQLVIGERTVETHLANIYRKLGVRSRIELITRFSDYSPTGR